MAESDESMFTVLKICDPPHAGSISQTAHEYAKVKIDSQVHAVLSLITQTHGTASILPRRRISGIIQSVGANRNER